MLDHPDSGAYCDMESTPTLKPEAEAPCADGGDTENPVIDPISSEVDSGPDDAHGQEKPISTPQSSSEIPAFEVDSEKTRVPNDVKDTTPQSAASLTSTLQAQKLGEDLIVTFGPHGSYFVGHGGTWT